MTDPAEKSTGMKRLRWRCRRGLLELDLLFEAYLDKGYADSTEEEKNDFLRLLEYPDQSLQEWLLGKVQPEDESLNGIIQRIQDSV
jgi:antitoxin CptB